MDGHLAAESQLAMLGTQHQKVTMGGYDDEKPHPGFNLDNFHCLVKPVPKRILTWGFLHGILQISENPYTRVQVVASLITLTN